MSAITSINKKAKQDKQERLETIMVRIRELFI